MYISEFEEIIEILRSILISFFYKPDFYLCLFFCFVLFCFSEEFLRGNLCKGDNPSEFNEKVNKSEQFLFYLSLHVSLYIFFVLQ